MEKLNTFQKLTKIQTELKAPKNQYNSFGKYSYRSCEDILESVKPLLEKYGVSLIISDEILNIGERFYVKAIVRFVNNDTGETLTSSALAREEDGKKGMDGSQVTGASSSYARKYALNGIFCIDDNKDADVTNTHGKESNQESAPAPKKTKSSGKITDNQRKRMFAIAKTTFGDNANNKLKEVIESYGFATTSDVTSDVYEEICSKLEKVA